MAPISVPPVQATFSSVKTGAIRDPSTDDIASEFPPWRVVLEECIQNNYQEGAGDVQVSLATIRPFGRPANRVVNFSGFMTDLPLETATTQAGATEIKRASTPKPATNSKIGTALSSFLAELMSSNEYDDTLIESMMGSNARTKCDPRARLNEAMLFAVDARSKVVEDALFGSRFTEVSWPMPGTPDQFRLSGTLHVILPPFHPLYGTAQIAPSMSTSNNIDWEAKRQSTWAALPAHRRNSLSNPSLDTIGRPLRRFSIVESYPSELLSQSAKMVAEPQESPEETMENNLALLILEVDGVDHLDRHGAGKRTKYRRTVGAEGQVEDDINPYDGKVRKVKHWLIQDMNA
ncbi:hypothetical protein SpCBS45565_g04480 [Spizellomyces sp. 'palustris']|nr:hypothetical protein SpCBS45565_g04480 [Spizellomyces sp. 'palustris']